jgi:hypothetical protein
MRVHVFQKSGAPIGSKVCKAGVKQTEHFDFAALEKSSLYLDGTKSSMLPAVFK